MSSSIQSLRNWKAPKGDLQDYMSQMQSTRIKKAKEDAAEAAKEAAAERQRNAAEEALRKGGEKKKIGFWKRQIETVADMTVFEILRDPTDFFETLFYLGAGATFPPAEVFAEEGAIEEIGEKALSYLKRVGGENIEDEKVKEFLEKVGETRAHMLTRTKFANNYLRGGDLPFKQFVSPGWSEPVGGNWKRMKGLRDDEYKREFAKHMSDFEKVSDRIRAKVRDGLGRGAQDYRYRFDRASQDAGDIRNYEMSGTTRQVPGAYHGPREELDRAGTARPTKRRKGMERTVVPGRSRSARPGRRLEPVPEEEEKIEEVYTPGAAAGDKRRRTLMQEEVQVPPLGGRMFREDRPPSWEKRKALDPERPFVPLAEERRMVPYETGGKEKVSRMYKPSKFRAMRRLKPWKKKPKPGVAEKFRKVRLGRNYQVYPGAYDDPRWAQAQRLFPEERRGAIVPYDTAAKRYERLWTPSRRFRRGVERASPYVARSRGYDGPTPENDWSDFSRQHPEEEIDLLPPWASDYFGVNDARAWGHQDPYPRATRVLPWSKNDARFRRTKFHRNWDFSNP